MRDSMRRCIKFFYFYRGYHGKNLWYDSVERINRIETRRLFLGCITIITYIVNFGNILFVGNKKDFRFNTYYY